jgi:hypothetical protein
LVGIHNKLKIEKSNKNKSKGKIFDRFKSFVTDQNTVSSPSDSSSQNLLILEEKNQKVLDKVFAKKFPKVTSSTSSFSGRNPGAFEAGRAAGGKINIYSAISPNSKVKYLTD